MDYPAHLQHDAIPVIKQEYPDIETMEEYEQAEYYDYTTEQVFLTTPEPVQTTQEEVSTWIIQASPLPRRFA